MRDDLSEGRVRVRKYRSEDAGALFEAASESAADVNRWLPWCHEGYTLAEAKDSVARRSVSWEKGDAYDFLIEDTATLGYVGGISINHVIPEGMRANLGYWVRTSRTGQGFATAAARLLGRWAMEDLGLTRLEIVVALGNKPSQRVAEKVGAVREGVLRNRLVIHGVFHDAVMYSLIPSDFGL
jgi:ribosomal-protein-serine acetyltransferase